jgi:hypothetical protein
MPTTSSNCHRQGHDADRLRRAAAAHALPRPAAQGRPAHADPCAREPHVPGKEDGLLVAYAPLADNLANALAEYTTSDQENKPVGRDVDEAVAIATEIVAEIREMLAGCDWRAIVARGGSRAWRTAATTATNFLRSAENPLNDPGLGNDRLSVRYRTATGQLARAWALASGRDGLAELHDEIAFYEEVRVWMAKFDAAERQARDEPVPEEISRLLGSLVAESIAPGKFSTSMTRPGFRGWRSTTSVPTSSPRRRRRRTRISRSRHCASR